MPLTSCFSAVGHSRRRDEQLPKPLLKKAELVAEMAPEPPVPMSRTQYRCAIESIACVQTDYRTGRHRLDAPAHRQHHAARRLVEDLLERQPNRTNLLYDLAAPKHRSGTTTISLPWRRRPGIRIVDRHAPATKCQRQHQRLKYRADRSVDADLMLLLFPHAAPVLRLSEARLEKQPHAVNTNIGRNCRL